MTVDIDNETEGHRRRNAALVESLRAQNVDTEVPREIEVHFWASRHENAVSFAKALYDAGFQLSVLAPSPSVSEPDMWNVEVTIVLSVQAVVSDDFIRNIIMFADNYAARFDGWGTSV